MAKQEYSQHQKNIISQYYDRLDTIMLTKLQELVTELYLADTAKKRDRLWQRVHKAMTQLKTPASIVEHIMAKKDVEMHPVWKYEEQLSAVQLWIDENFDAARIEEMKRETNFMETGYSEYDSLVEALYSTSLQDTNPAQFLLAVLARTEKGHKKAHDLLHGMLSPVYNEMNKTDPLRDAYFRKRLQLDEVTEKALALPASFMDLLETARKEVVAPQYYTRREKTESSYLTTRQ